ncbi:hypothetical protein K1T71_004770 [Dendrolimus kikuchii]|uniref:Uncharacterized protein n=1 Tax=Dendrolimus kikuchii TaxID=765133 RepID=A0ACC1D8C0_9NEOP|nr:hypothetical protein K1T71_004770 [Dendrolimus kikuchii]
MNDILPKRWRRGCGMVALSCTHVLRGAVRRTTTQSSANATRDSQLLSLLKARRRQLIHGRLATHINAFASLAHKANITNTTFAQLEVKNSNSSIVKKITFANSSNDINPTLRLITTDGTKEIKQDIKPHEIRHLFIPKIFQENRSRVGYMNSRRREAIGLKTVTTQDQITESSIVYLPPDKLEGLDKDVDLDPDEEFQVDESNHGLYLLNYSDTENVTQIPSVNITISIVKENTTIKTLTTTPIANSSKESITIIEEETEDKPELNFIANSTLIFTNKTKLLKIDPDSRENQTLFMSDEIYNHFRPLETELPVEDMAPFIYFGQKLGGQVISDNLTNSPTLSASTKSVNFIVAPPEKRKFNSRYSATEKYKNTSIDEEEINEDMDVSVVKNIIEKNKIRNTVKGPAPARPVGLVSAYRKFSTTTPSSTKSLNIAQLNVTEPIVQNVTPTIISKVSNTTNTTTVSKDIGPKLIFNANNVTMKETLPKINATIPRNFTRSYFNLRRRPPRVNPLTSTEILPTIIINTTTTEKASTVYTAVVTSVSITSSMKGANKTDPLKDADNATVSRILNDTTNITTPKQMLVNETETTTSTTTTTQRPYKHRIRIRTTTTENANKNKPTESPTSDPINNAALNNETITTMADHFAILRQETEISSTSRPRNTSKRRRPTTTPSTTTIPTTLSENLPSVGTTNIFTTSPTTTTFKPVITSRISSESSNSNPTNNLEANQSLNNSKAEEREDSPSQNEEVVIEAEKTYTASYVLAGLGFLPVAAIIVFVLRSVLNKKTKEIDTEYEGYFEDGDIKKESSITPVARPPLPAPIKPDQKWEFPRNKLRLQTLLGQGNFGQVWKAEADDLNGHDGLTRLVAVKSIKETASQKEKQELLNEIYIMQKIGTHPNVVTLLACCTEQEPYLLIMEYVMCGKLLTYLRERRSRPDRFSGSGALTSRDLTVFAYCVARGMDYIASKGIVHRDLAARNVLVDHNKLCKIADFGMSRCAGAGARGGRGALPVRWMAPEALLYNVYSHHTDVWAFGILLWEIVTLGSTPYAAMSGREVLAAVTEGYRLERPPHCKVQLYRAMHACWHADPSQRPSFATLKAQLAELLDNEPSEGNYVDLDSFYQESSVYSDPSAIINDEEGLSAEYDRERRCFRELILVSFCEQVMFAKEEVERERERNSLLRSRQRRTRRRRRSDSDLRPP